mgnify:CR=1 FL=1
MQDLPVVQIRHPDYECDDVIANLAKLHTESGNDVVIVSGDSDFIQVFDSMSESIFITQSKRSLLKNQIMFILTGRPSEAT